MQIVTFNIKLGVDSHLAEIAKDLLLMKPDICVIQEIGNGWQMGVPIDQTAYIANAIDMPNFQFVRALEDSKGGGFGIACLSKFPMSEIQIEALPRIKDEQRVLFSAKIHSDQGDFYLYTTHLSILEAERNLQFDYIAQKILKQKQMHHQHHQHHQLLSYSEPAIVLVGDLNDLETSQGISKLNALGLIDAWRSLHPNTQDEDSYTFSVKKPNRRIDYLFAQGFEIESAQILRSYCSSDHFPLKVKLDLSRSS